MTDWKCPRCDRWFEYEDHDTDHIAERQVEALERIAKALENKPKTVHYTVQQSPPAVVDARAKGTRTHDL